MRVGVGPPATGGEAFFILDATEQPNPLQGVPDFWIFDSADTAVMRYDDQGAFLWADLLPPDGSAEFARYRDTALTHSEPFTD